MGSGGRQQWCGSIHLCWATASDHHCLLFKAAKGKQAAWLGWCVFQQPKLGLHEQGTSEQLLRGTRSPLKPQSPRAAKRSARHHWARTLKHGESQAQRQRGCAVPWSLANRLQPADCASASPPQSKFVAGVRRKKRLNHF